MVQLTQDGAEKKLAAEEISAEVLRMMKEVAEVKIMNIFWIDDREQWDAYDSKVLSYKTSNFWVANRSLRLEHRIA